MSTERRGKVKLKLWVQAVCGWPKDPHRLALQAREDFREQCKGEREPFHVLAPEMFEDVFDDALQPDYKAE